MGFFEQVERIEDHFPFAILHFSFVIAGVTIPEMTNEKCNMANGK
jgi:hypothetical protein